MKNVQTPDFYRDIPVVQKERLQAFRVSHPRQESTLSGIKWSYLQGGQGKKTMLFLPGGERIGDVAFPLMLEMEQEYRCLYPTYPPLPSMSGLVESLAALLDELSIEKIILFAPSFGGDVGQCFVRKYPDRVSHLILMNTGAPDKRIGKATQRVRPLVTQLPMSIVRILIQQFLGKALSSQPEVQRFWQAALRELIANLTRDDIVSSFDETIDYRLNYDFAPDDLLAWSGKLLLLQSDDDPATTESRRLELRKLYPQAQVHTFHRAGHTPFLSQPDKFYPLIHTFLNQP